MDARALGPGGPALSVIGLGCNNFGMRIDRRASHEVVRAALDAGITHFDTAEMYGSGQSEEFLGEALGADRHRAVIATKFLPRPADQPYEPGALAARIRQGCDISLRRLGTDSLDVYYQHYPDPAAPLEEALEALDELVRAGKVRHVASSNPTAELIDANAELATARQLTASVGVQVEWSLLVRAVEAEVIPAAARHGLGVVPYFPLASGLLTGKYRAGVEFPAGSRLASSAYFAAIATPERFAAVERLTGYAADHGHTLVELAVSWLLAQPTVTSVIAGATTPEQVLANAAAGSWPLTTDQLAEIDRILAGGPG